MKTISNKAFLRILSSSGACYEARQWVKEHGGNSAELWRDCQRGDWMAWIVARQSDRFGITRQQLVLALTDCATLALKYYEAKYPDDKRVRECLNTCRRWAKGKATDLELEHAYATASAAAYAANAAVYAVYAAYAAAYAANAAVYAVYAAYAAAYAAVYAAYATASAAYADGGVAREKTLLKCANIFRKHFPMFAQQVTQ